MKTKTPSTTKATTPTAPPQTLSQCFLEHAARETEWANALGKECDYQSAADALERRSVWLMAALIAQERKL